MKSFDALAIPPGRSVIYPPSAGAVVWDQIPSLKSTLVYSAATVSVAGGDHYHRAVGTWSGFVAGDLVDVAGFAAPGNNYRKRVASVSGADLFVTGSDPLVNVAAGAAVTFTRIDDLPDRILVVGTSATTGKMSFGRVGDSYPANDSTFFFVGLKPRILQVSGYEILWYTAGAGGNTSVSPIANL